ncbi:MAG: DNA cytosine methyltransferase [Oscillospiraceae bacterium]|nr:DNA cytosine methyltransferase [Oscillospiraceae bacterium]MBQ8622732.1 DNA cytosine methyltransferase [Oscillospiraceae bacterium]MBQ8835659.1 DNA cytosine methyltransferase [Oscillospiraceae bacterium]MBQ8835823.1 DNA cytosine methyltransferase [Oscillospiraceae bacterium]
MKRAKTTPQIGQTSLFQKIAVDNFAGGGGASIGIELALGQPVAVAINHDPAAILMHRTNHPHTEHLQASVWDVDPVEVCKGRPVGLAWFSPDCKHFSKAKGASLVDKKIRGLAWITLRWAAKVRPDVIMLENVEEFQTWGPVRKGKPIKKKAGQTFRKFIQQLEDLGYVVEYRELIAADYGAPTTRKRFVLVARCDGKPIRWPEPTHAHRDSEAVKSGKLLPWRSAAEIIDWTIPSYSIFASKAEIKEKYGVKVVRPLANNTMRRVIRGVDKFTIKSGNPFIVECNHSGDSHTRAIDEPVNTVTRKYTGGVCGPVLAPLTIPNTCNSVGSPASEPVYTVTSAGNQLFVAANLMSIGQTGGGDRIRDMQEPAPTTVSKQEACMVAANLIQYHTEQSEKVRGQSMNDAIMTVDSSNRYGLACANLVEYYGNGNPLDVSQPMHTVTAHDREAVVSAHIQKYFGGVVGVEASGPLPTVTTADHNALCSAHVVKFKGQELGQHPTDTLNTITAQGNEYAQCNAVLAKAGGHDLGHWPEIRALLNQHCGYHLADDEVILLVIFGVAYYIADITLRMLTPRELYNAMGFPPDYIIDYDYTGNKYPKNEQVARCGNAVCPPLAEAMVRANMPDMCGAKIRTMAELNDAIAV